VPSLFYNRAKELEYIGRFAQSRASYTQCVEFAEQLSSPAKLDCLIGLASLALESGNVAAAETALDAASASLALSHPATSREAIRIQNVRGAIQMRHGQFAEARANLDAVVAGAKSASLTFMGLRNRAEVNLLDGNLAAAEADARSALQTARSSQGDMPYSNRAGLAQLILGRVLAAKGESAKAKDAFKDAVENLSNTVDDQHPMLKMARDLASG